MKPHHILSFEGKAIGIINWKIKKDGFADTVRFPMKGEYITVKETIYMVALVHHKIEKDAIVYHLIIPE